MAYTETKPTGEVVAIAVTRVPLDLLAWIDETARIRRESRSAVIASMLTAIAQDT